MACVTAAGSAGSQSKSGNPCPRFTAFFSAASADITEKIVVPTSGNLEAGMKLAVVVIFSAGK
jgi:hypothetical protein